MVASFSLLLAAALAAGARAAEPASVSWFDAAPSWVEAGTPRLSGADAAALRERHPARPPAIPDELSGAAARWANAVQGARIGDPGPGATFRIAVIGDAEPGRFVWERLFSPGRDAFARQIRAIHALAPSAIVQLGDFVSEGTVDNYRAHVAFLDAQVRLPYLSVTGNHDRSHPNGAANKDLYHAVFGSGDYLVDVGDWRLILVDSADRRVGPEQLDWLERALAASRPTVLFTHVPPAYLKPAFGTSSQSEKGVRGYHPFQAYFDEGASRFEELVSKHPVARVYVGHIHAYASARYRGVTYVLSGGGGSPLYPLPPGYPQTLMAHFIEAELSPSGVRDTVHPLNDVP